MTLMTHRTNLESLLVPCRNRFWWGIW